MAASTIKLPDGTTLEIDLEKAEDCLKLFEKMHEFISKNTILESWISKDLEEAFKKAKDNFKKASTRQGIEVAQLDKGDDLRRKIKKTIEQQKTFSAKIKYGFAFLWHKVIKAAGQGLAGFVKRQVDKVKVAWTERELKKSEKMEEKLKEQRAKEDEKLKAKRAKEDEKLQKQKEKCAARLNELVPHVPTDSEVNLLARALNETAAAAASSSVSGTENSFAGGVRTAAKPRARSSSLPATTSPSAGVAHVVANSSTNPVKHAGPVSHPSSAGASGAAAGGSAAGTLAAEGGSPKPQAPSGGS